MQESRRTFVKNTAKTAGLFPFVSTFAPLVKDPPPVERKLSIHIFSKHLQFLEYPEMAKMAAQIGFNGVELTVRPGGHVLPENVEKDLPRAIDAIGNAGLEPFMMVSSVKDAANPVDKKVLQTASRLGTKYYRTAYFRYSEDASIPEDIRVFQKQAKMLSDLNKALGLVGCYQNHAGNYVGASMFELYQIFKDVDPDHMGLQYDIRHATVEGGRSWETGLRLVHPQIRTLAIKDFRWEQRDGKWETVNVPLGAGMVDFKKYFSLLKKYNVQVPASLHLEYPIGGAEHGDREISIKPDQVFEAMKKDLDFVHRAWAEAGVEKTEQ
jgi:sugar phosphate isomerase/epimerase